MDPAELRLLFESSAHLVITYQDLIAFRIPLVFASESSFETYRATSRLVLPAVQRIIAYLGEREPRDRRGVRDPAG